ncbi:MAG: NUDIX domain-containing protein [Promethearchaeota archaeon]
MNVKLFDNPLQQLIVIDANGKETGQIVDRKTAHTTPGIKHLAIQILVFTSQKELILHKRPSKKVGGGDVWDAPTTHVLNGETREQAARRCLKDEYGITENTPLSILSGYSYKKDYGDGTCENEYCLAAFVVYDGEIDGNHNHVEEIKYISTSQVFEELISNPRLYPIWFNETIQIVKLDFNAQKLFNSN